MNSMIFDVESTIVPILEATESEYVADGYVETLEAAFSDVRSQYDEVAIQAKVVATSFVDDVNGAHRARFIASMRGIVGVDLEAIVRQEGLEPVLRAAVQQNVSLIKTIPSEYFNKIEQAVYENTVQGTSARSLEDLIHDIGHSTKKRARFIARDQTSKLNGNLTMHRQMALGIEEYIWVTAGDGDRVRKTHQANDGKTFRWDSAPTETGHPGHDPNCRCRAKGVVKI